MEPGGGNAMRRHHLGPVASKGMYLGHDTLPLVVRVSQSLQMGQHNGDVHGMSGIKWVIIIMTVDQLF